MDDAGDISNQEEGRYIPADDRNRLSDRERETPRHVEQEGEVRDDGEAKRESINGEQPRADKSARNRNEYAVSPC